MFSSCIIFSCSSGSSVLAIASSTARPVTSPAPNLAAIPPRAIFLPASLYCFLISACPAGDANSLAASLFINSLASSLLISLAASSIPFLRRLLPTNPVKTPAAVPAPGATAVPIIPPAIEVAKASPTIPTPCPAMKGINSVNTVPMPCSHASVNESDALVPLCPIAFSDSCMRSKPAITCSSESIALPART